MATVNETSQSPNELAAGLQLAVGTISADQTLNFILYRRVVLPIDGYVFWVNCVNSPPSPLPASPLTFNVQGSLHYAQDSHQDSDATYSQQTAKFTATALVEEFGDIAPDTMYVTTMHNGTKLAFNGQIGRYDQAGLWHYVGRAVYGVQYSQIVENISDIDTTQQIVSNSMPLWLVMGTTDIPLYPAFLSPFNLHPPYITADIDGTEGVGQSPLYDSLTGQTQLASENVKFTFYGLNNLQVMNFQMALLNNSLSGTYGIQNIPIPIDEKLTQSEIRTIAQKKSMILKTNYYQFAVRDIAQQMTETAGITLNPLTHP